MIVTTYKRPRFRGVRGLGDNPLVATPSYANCDPRDTACVNANEVLNTSYNLAVQTAEANNNYTQCLANAANAVGTAQIQATLNACNGQFITQAPTGATPVNYQSSGGGMPALVGSAGQFSFSTSNGLPMNVGDSWTVQISGAPIGVGVSVSGSKNGVSFGTVGKGNTDSMGRFTLSGTVGSSDAGSWVETWMVGNSPVGNISFNVNPVPSVVSNITPTVTGNTTPPSQAGASTLVTPIVTPPSNTISVPTASTVFDLFGDTSTPINIFGVQVGEYTAIGLAAVVVVGLMMMGGKGRR